MSAAMHTYRFDVQAFATVEVTAPSERRARQLLDDHCLDESQGTHPDGCKVLVVSISADDGEPYLMDEGDY